MTAKSSEEVVQELEAAGPDAVLKAATSAADGSIEWFFLAGRCARHVRRQSLAGELNSALKWASAATSAYEAARRQPYYMRQEGVFQIERGVNIIRILLISTFGVHPDVSPLLNISLLEESISRVARELTNLDVLLQARAQGSAGWSESDKVKFFFLSESLELMRPLVERSFTSPAWTAWSSDMTRRMAQSAP